MAKKKKEEKKKKSKKTTEADTTAQDESHGRALASELYSQGSLGRLSQPTAISTISTEMGGGAQSISQAEDLYNKALEKDQYMEAALQAGLASLKGLDSAENQAFKTQALRGIQDNAKTNMRQIRQSSGEMGAGMTAAALRRAQRDSEKDTRTALTDLAVSNVGLKQNALKNFGDLSTSAFSAQQNARQGAMGQLLQARRDVGDYRLGAERINADIMSGNRDMALGVDKYNLDQSAAEKAGWIGTMFGSQGVDQARRNQRNQNRLAQKMIEEAAR